MVNRLAVFSKQVICTGLLAAGISAVPALPASSQVLPEVWATVGGVDDSVSYGAGARFLGTGIEVGRGEDGAVGGDFLTFISLPVVSPYAGLGFYSGDETVAFSGGVHFNADRLVLGAGYHSVRGFNGQLGFSF